jgi:hypothetical protein
MGPFLCRVGQSGKRPKQRPSIDRVGYAGFQSALVRWPRVAGIHRFVHSPRPACHAQITAATTRWSRAERQMLDVVDAELKLHPKLLQVAAASPNAVFRPERAASALSGESLQAVPKSGLQSIGQSTSRGALYPALAMTWYLIALPFSLLTRSGSLVSGFTNSTFIRLNLPSREVFVG